MNSRAERLERRLQWPMLVAALLTIPAIAIEESDVAEPWDTLATVINWTVWIAFLAEAILMLRAVDDRWKWVRDHPLEVALTLTYRRPSSRRKGSQLATTAAQRPSTAACSA